MSLIYINLYVYGRVRLRHFKVRIAKATKQEIDFRNRFYSFFGDLVYLGLNKCSPES